MLLDRLAISIPLVPVAIWVIYLGGPVFAGVIVLMLALGAREYWRMFHAGGARPARPLLMAGAPLLAAVHWLGGETGVVFALLLTAALIWHLVDFERGAPGAGTDFALTVGGLVYLGWMGSYFVIVRALPEGLWWAVILFGSIWLADSGAYIVGRWLGRHPLAPRLSPKKTWEGFGGGILGGGLGGALIAAAAGLNAGPHSLVGWPAGLLLGALVGLVGPLGDLGISMFKRQAGLKDSGQLLAGHGGVLDRVDSWFIAIPFGYYGLLCLQTWWR